MIKIGVFHLLAVLLVLIVQQHSRMILISVIDERKVVEPSANLLQTEQDHQLKVLLFALLPFVVAFAFMVFLFYRQRREAYFKQTEAELKLSMARVEIKALRAQMNPHFIFNCLNSIHHYMHQRNIHEAGDYLVKFSQLIRHILETSAQRTVPLSDEIYALTLYLNLEQLRMDHAFDFEITTDKTLLPEAIYIPPMLIQPFVENSIWHGLNNRGKGGKINIHIVRQGGMLKCTVEDNGESDIHETPPSPIAVKKSSMGMALVREQLEVTSKLYNVQATFDIVDIVDVDNQKIGKRVNILLPYEE
jgi:LytS/YehU family sensor histidine kinase